MSKGEDENMEYWAFTTCEEISSRPHAEAFARLLEQIEVADQGRLDGFFLAEHHSNPRHSLTASPNLVLAAAGQRTRRLHLGNMVTVLPFHHPLRAAEEIRLLDALTSGRLEVGLGRGGASHEQTAWGLDRSEADGMFDAGLELLVRFLTEESVDYRTKWWAGSGATAVPEPTQEPHPPLWLTAVSGQAIEKAARLGMHCHTSFPYPDLSRLRERVEAYRAAWEKHRPGTPPGRFAVLVAAVVAKTDVEARRCGGRFAEARLEHFKRAVRSRLQGTERNRYTSDAPFYEDIRELTLEELADRGLIVFGSVENCAQQVARLKATGIDALTAWVPAAHPDREFANRSLRLFCEGVIPRVEGGWG